MLDFFYKKKILITGHTGFKGAWISRMLLLAGADITGYALEPPTSPSLYDTIDLEGNIRSYIADIRDGESLKKVFAQEKPEFVLHMAAQPIVRTSYEMPVYTYETNVMGTVNIMECLRLNPGVRSFLNVTTDKVYDNQETDRAYEEGDFLDGYDPYSNSKSCSELVTHSYQRSFLRDLKMAVSTARAGNVIGGGDFARDRIVPDCARAAISGKTLLIRNPNAIRPFQHVLEPLYAYLMILQRQAEDRLCYEGAFNVGPDEEDCVSAGEIAALFAKYWGEGFEYEIKSDGGPHEAGFLKLNCKKLKETYGWRPVYRVADALEKTIDWFKRYRDGEDMSAVCDRQIEAFDKEFNKIWSKRDV
ncbi:MAG: CDP-glucose 4,6-dehydratase [Johnsonella sp.]|nr:CDP-glucose 4,6-dehydratase [Johnsonella sp.]